MPIILPAIGSQGVEFTGTAEEICSEGLKKAGYSSSSSQWSSLLTRAEDYWLAEIKTDVMEMEKKLSTLQTSSSPSLSSYSNGFPFPSDYAALCNMWLLDSNGNIIHDILPKPVWYQMNEIAGEPLFYSPKGDGTFLLSPPPDLSKGFSVKILYYADLLLIAIDGQAHDTFLRKHRVMFVQGIFTKALSNKNDTRSDKEDAKYQGYVKLAVSRERLGAEYEGERISSNEGYGLMAYKGTTFAVSYADAGFNGNYNQDIIPPSGLIAPSRNINIHQGGIGKRGGTSIVDTIAGNPHVLSLFDYSVDAATNILLRTASDGKLYRDNSYVIETGFSQTEPCSFEIMNKKVYIAGFGKAPKIWSGRIPTAYSASVDYISTGDFFTTPLVTYLGHTYYCLTTNGPSTAIHHPDSGLSWEDITNFETQPCDLSADWTGTNFPLAFKNHGSGNSQRLWALLPSGAYYSTDNDGVASVDFHGTGSGQIPINTSDGVGLTALEEFNDRIIYFSKKKAFFVDDSNADDSLWGYRESVWLGGVSHQRLLVRTPNDMIAMMDDGEIYSVTKAQAGIDYQAASITRPSFMHNYIKDNVDLSQINRFHAVYDPVLRAIRFFVYTNLDMQTCLIYFIDSGKWTIHDGADNATGNSGFKNVFCSALVKNADSGNKIYTGDGVGNVWMLESGGFSDNGNAFWAGITTPPWNCGNPRIKKSYDSLRLTGRIQLDSFPCDLTVDTYIDGVKEFTNTANLGTSIIVDTEFVLGSVGTRCSHQIYNNSATQSWFISGLMLDFVNLGAGVLP